MKIPQSLRDLMEGAASLVYVEDLSGKKGVMQAINPVAKLVAIVGMIVAAVSNRQTKLTPKLNYTPH